MKITNRQIISTIRVLATILKKDISAEYLESKNATTLQEIQKNLWIEYQNL